MKYRYHELNDALAHLHLELHLVTDDQTTVATNATGCLPGPTMIGGSARGPEWIGREGMIGTDGRCRGTGGMMMTDGGTMIEITSGMTIGGMMIADLATTDLLVMIGLLATRGLFGMTGLMMRGASLATLDGDERDCGSCEA